MGNRLTDNLPADVDEKLMDIAHMFPKESGINFSDIIAFSEVASDVEIVNVRNALENFYDILEDDSEMEELFRNLSKIVKGVEQC